MAPEIVMQTPAAKALEAAVQKQLGEYGYSNPDDPVMAEYVVVMLANSKGADDITQELRELVGEDLYDVSFTSWLFDEVGRQLGGGASTSDVKPQDGDGPVPGEAGTSSIPTQPDSRDRRPSGRGGGGGGGGGGGYGGNVFSQAMTGLKRPAPDAGLRDPPPHRRRVDDVEPAPAGPRRNDRRDDRSDWAAGPPPMRDRGPGPGRGGRGGGGQRSLLERTGMSGGGAVNPAFLPNGGGGGGAAMEHMVQMQLQNLAQQQHHQMMMAQQHPGFFPPGGTPQLFLANGQPFIPPPNYNMHQQSPSAPSSARTGPPSPQRDLSTLPKKPDGKECKYNSACKNAWCPNAHVSPAGTKESMLLSFEPCEKQTECSDKDCTKAHVSPQQKDPNASVWAKPATSPAPKPVVPSPAAHPAKHAARPTSLNPTPCRFGAGCTRPDCVFTHPWDAKAGSVPVPCKFGNGCTRADCHFQHPPGRKLASKNISKSFVEQIGPMPATDESKMNRLKRFGDAAAAAAAGGEVERIVPGEQKENGKVNGGGPAAAEEGNKEPADASEASASPAGQVLAQ